MSSEHHNRGKSQEPRILAYVSQDPVLLETFEKERDVYSVLISTARGLTYEECTKEACHAREEEWEARGKIGPKPVNYRNQGKVLQLALSYGLGASALSDKLEIPLEEAEQLMKDFKQNLSGVFEYEARLKEFARKSGYVETLGGRKRRFPEYALPEFTITGAQGQPVPEVLKQQIANKFKYVWKYNERAELVTQLEMQHQVNIVDNNMTRNEDATQILNSVIQGSAADMVKLAMLKLYRNPRFHEMKCSLYLLIHDEIIIDVPEQHVNEAKELLEKSMLEAAYTLVPSVPFVADAMVMDYWVKD